MIKTYERRGACRSACMNFPSTSMRLQLHNLKANQIIDTLVAKFRKVHDATPQHDTFKTPGQASPNPATLETLGSTPAVPLHRLEAWKAACVNSWIHRHGSACGKEFVSELSCRNHACRTTAEQRQLFSRILSLPRQAMELLATNSKKTDFGSKLEAKI